MQQLCNPVRSGSNYSVNGESIQSLSQGNNNKTIINNFHDSFQTISQGIKRLFSNIFPKTTQESPNLVAIERTYHIQQEQLDIERHRLKHDIIQAGQTYELQQRALEIQEQDLEYKKAYFTQKLQLIKECHDELVQFKLQEFELNWDLQRSPLILSPAKTRTYLQRDPDCLWVLFSPIKLSCYIERFGSLSTEVDNRLEELANSFDTRDSSGNSIVYPIRYLKIFDQPIEKLTAMDMRDQLSPIPTLILQSEITDENIFICITSPKPFEPADNPSGRYQVTLPAWNWQSIKLALENIGYSEEDSIKTVKELMILIHEVIVLYFADLYLLSLDPYHAPRTFDFLDNPSCSSILNQWIKPFRDSLLQFQERAIQQSKENQDQQFFENGNIYTDTSNVIDLDNIQWIPIAIAGFVIMILSGFCSQQPQRPLPVVVNPTNEILHEQEKYGTVQIAETSISPFANLWTEPNGNQKVGELGQGSRVAILAVSNDSQWYRVQSQDGKQGWIYSETILLEP
ncbi:MAG: SH3 domain-containing protein [Cyanobacteria bacterium P01_D01_bin.156]